MDLGLGASRRKLKGALEPHSDSLYNLGSLFRTVKLSADCVFSMIFILHSIECHFLSISTRPLGPIESTPSHVKLHKYLGCGESKSETIQSSVPD